MNMAAILARWPIEFVIHLLPSTYEIWVNWPSAFWEYCFNILVGLNMRDLGWKVNLEIWNLFIAIVSLGLTYQVRIMTLASTVLKKTLKNPI